MFGRDIGGRLHAKRWTARAMSACLVVALVLFVATCEDDDPESQDVSAQQANTPMFVPGLASNRPLEAGSRVSWQAEAWYLHGANLPWYSWACDFGCGDDGGVSSDDARAAIEPRLREASEAGMRTIRWWMFPGDPWQVETDGSGAPTRIEEAVFADIEAALAMAEEYDLYYVFVLFSGPDGIPREWMTGETQREALANVLGVELFRRYAGEARILSWEIFNEPEWHIWSGDFTEEEVVDMVRAVAARANAETPAHVTVGSAMLDALEMWVGAGLDYYQAHWYDYMESGDWCARCTDYESVRERYGLDAPLVIGEYYSAPDDALERLEDWYAKGFAGAWAWSLMPGRTEDGLAVNLEASREFSAGHDDLGPR